jgi:hypothetical protein
MAGGCHSQYGLQPAPILNLRKTKIKVTTFVTTKWGWVPRKSNFNWISVEKGLGGSVFRIIAGATHEYLHLAL